jgi:hypothetical protein
MEMANGRNQVAKIITHKEVLKQCRNKLARKYPGVEIVEGAGELMEPARVWRRLSPQERLSQTPQPFHVSA